LTRIQLQRLDHAQSSPIRISAKRIFWGCSGGSFGLAPVIIYHV
jgi:hypothetical protein